MLVARLLKIAEQYLAKVAMDAVEPQTDTTGATDDEIPLPGIIGGLSTWAPSKAVVDQIYVSVPGGASHTVTSALFDVGSILGITLSPVRDFKAFGFQYMAQGNYQIFWGHTVFSNRRFYSDPYAVYDVLVCSTRHYRGI